MDYRDEREALRNRIEALEQQANAGREAETRVAELERELREARKKLDHAERGIAELRGRSRSPAGALFAAIGVAVLVAAGGVMVAFRMAARKPAPPAIGVAVPVPADVPNTAPDDGPGAGGVVPAGEHLQWGAGFGPSVAPVFLNDDAVEDFVGLYRIMSEDLYVGGFDGKTLGRVWKSAPLGSLSDGVAYTHFALAGRRVAVTDFRANVHVLEVATGAEVGKVVLSDRARRVCAPPKDVSAVWIEVADGKDVLVDTQTLTSKPSSAPAWCRPRSTPGSGCEGGSAACSLAGASVRVAGFRAEVVLAAGDRRVAIGARDPGTATPMAVGLDARGGATWTATLPDDPAIAHPGAPLADLAAGKLFACFELSSRGSRLVALDVETGARLWDVQVPRSTEGSGPWAITATATRVYVPHWTWLDVLDATNGKLVGTVGKW